MSDSTTDNSYPSLPPEEINIVVLISGGGSNLQAIIKSCEDTELPARISCVISNKAEVYGLIRAKKAQIPTEVVDHSLYSSRELFDHKLQEVIDRYKPHLVVLAGFMRILTAGFVRHYQGKILNIHPSLLPKYPGLHTHQRAIEAGDNIHGATVHFVTEDLDGGPPIIQAMVPVLKNTTPIELAKSVLQQEHIIYPIAVRWFVSGRLQMKKANNMGRSSVVLDGTVLPEEGLRWSAQS